MRSFLAYVADQYGRKKEDVATDALAYLLRRHTDARTAFQSFVAEKCDYELPKEWSLLSRTKGPNGVPDLRITDESDICCAIVEMKFRARLTESQPVGYFEELDAQDGLLLFVVPKDRISELWKHLEGRCKDAGRAIERVPGARFSRQSARNWLCVVSWEQLIQHLRNSMDKEDTRHAEALVFIDQLGRVCEMAEKEVFDNLTVDQINGTRTPALIRQLVWIAQESIRRCIDEKIVQEKGKKGFHAKVEDTNSSLFVGQSLWLYGIDTWIGFWPKAWEEYKVSPLWIVFYPPKSGEIQFVERIPINQIGSAPLKQPFFCEDERGWLIPIPIEPNRSQDDVVDDAFRFVTHIRSAVQIAKDGPST